MPSISVPTAIAIGGGLSAAGGIASGIIGANAASGAARTQAQAAQYAAQLQAQEIQQTRNDLSPFREAGASVLPGLEALLGVYQPGGNATATLNALKATPGYQFVLDQGLLATQNGYAAQGLSKSGAALKGAANYAEGLAGTTYNSIVANEMGLATLGENAAAMTGELGMQGVGAQSNLLTGAAAAQAAGQVGSAGALAGGLSGFSGGIGNALLGLALNGSGGIFGNSGTSAVTNALNDPVLGPLITGT